MIKQNIIMFIVVCFNGLSAQQKKVIPVRDSFMSIVTDARAAGQGDIGVATSADAFSQFWNPSKYIFSSTKSEIGITNVYTTRNQFGGLSQLNLNFSNKLNNRSAYGVSFRGYGTKTDQLEGGRTTSFQDAVEMSIDGSYALRLNNTFAMSVSGRFILIGGKILSNDFNDESSLYGVDVSGFYNGNELAYKKFNGRWRAGFSFSNLRGKSLKEDKGIEVYAPSMVKLGIGFDFIFNQDNMLGITTEYKMLLDSYTENINREKLEFGLQGAVIAMGLEYMYREKITIRTGHSHGINRLTDSFISIGTGFKEKYIDVDIACLLGLSEEENPVREKLRLSLILNLEKVFFN